MPKNDQEQNPSIQWLRQRAALAIALAASVVVATTGVVYDRGRNDALVRYMDRRSEGVIVAVEQITLSARSEAAILALQSRVGVDIQSSLRIGLPAESALLERDPLDPNLMKVTRVVSVGPSGSLFREGRVLAQQGALVSDGISTSLMPATAPTHLAFCVNGRGTVVACAAANIADVLRAASAASIYGLEARIVGPRERPLAQTASYDDASEQWGVSRSAIPHTPIEILAKPPPGLIAIFQVNLGLWLAAIGLAAIWIGYFILVVLQRSSAAQRQLAAEVVREKEGKLALLRKSLHDIAGIGGLRFFLVAVDSKVELFGPWAEQPGIEDNIVTLEQLFLATDRPDELVAGARAALNKREPWSQVFNRSVEGEATIQQSSATPIFVGGNYLGMVGVASDITVAMDAQNVRHETKSMQDALATYLRHLGQEVSGPILHAKASLALLKTASERGDVDQTMRWHEVAESSLQRLSEVVKASVDLMKLRQSDRTEELQRRNTRELVDLVSRNMASMLAERVQKIEVEDLSTRPALVHTRSLLKMLKHVVSNAVLYSPSDSTIHIAIQDQGERCEIEIEDEGPGMNDAELAQIGQPFFRGSSALAMNIRGSGLGVAMTLELARHSAAKVRFARSPVAGRGMRVTITLPTAREVTPRRSEISGGSRDMR